jgi:hypothetical protein
MPGLPRQVQPVSEERLARKRALWSVHYHGAGLDPSVMPDTLRPAALTEAMDMAAKWDDEHAGDRRIHCVKRLNPTFRRGVELPKKDSDRGDRLRQLKVDDEATELGRARRINTASARDVLGQIKVHAGNKKRDNCIPKVDTPGFDALRGRSSLLSRLNVNRPLQPELACLLDPRGWPKCSDLFDDTYRVTQIAPGEYRRMTDDPQPLGTDWSGLLYELAGAGPQAVENILAIDFKVQRTCYKGKNKPLKCREGTCAHAILKVEVDYGLHDSLTYRVGGMEFPGLMRQNHGFFRAKPGLGGTTEVSCKKTIRFARLTDWSTSFGGAYDYGELLNYTAPTYLSLWIYDVTQIVPCCNRER